MSITDELRELSSKAGIYSNACGALRELADRIDREMVELPKDADGEYIHFGDVLDQFGTPMTVFAMSDPDPDQGDCMLELITDGIGDGTWVRARKMRHHHATNMANMHQRILMAETVIRRIDKRLEDGHEAD